VFRLAVVGAGRMGQLHLTVLREVKNIAVVGVVESLERTRQHLAAQGVPVFADVKSLIAETSVDGWLVAVPTAMHVQVVTDLADYGLPILCEKPAGLSVSEAIQIGQVASLTGVRVQVAYWRRFVPDLQQLRARIGSGAFGSVQSIICQQWDETPPSPEYRQGSGGIFIDMGVHEIDQLRWLTGAELDPIAAVARLDPDSGDEDSAHGLVELSSGASGAISLGRFHPGGDFVAVEIFGSRRQERLVLLDPLQGDLAQRQALQAQIRDFVDGTGQCASLADAVAAFRVAEVLQADLL
jgi:myo-inositol 2-dehydrogenase/D-chiro-inositol 1-dehydrogenase